MSDQPPPTQPYAQPPAAPPVYPQPAMPASAPPQPKKGRGCLISAIIAGVVLLAIVGIGFAVVSSMGKPRDLGVRYSLADYHRAVLKTGLDEFAGAGDTGSTDDGAAGLEPDDSKTDDNSSGDSGSKGGASKGGSTKGGSTAGGSGSAPAPAGPLDAPDGSGFTGEVIYTGNAPFDVVLTAAEMSALLNYSHMPGWPISQAQVVFTGSNGFIVSCYFEYAGVKYPVYAEGTVGISGGVLNGMASSAQVLGYSIPAEYLGPGSNYVVGIINDRLARVSGLSIDEAEIVDGGLHLVGTGAAAAEAATP